MAIGIDIVNIVDSFFSVVEDRHIDGRGGHKGPAGSAGLLLPKSTWECPNRIW